MNTVKFLVSLIIFAIANITGSAGTVWDDLAREHRIICLKVGAPCKSVVLNIYLGQLNDKTSELAKQVESTKSSLSYSGQILEEGLLTAISNDGRIQSIPIHGKASEIPVKDVKVAVDQLKKSLGDDASFIFYHDHTKSGGNLSDSDVRLSLKNKIIVIARYDRDLNITVPLTEYGVRLYEIGNYWPIE